MPKSKSIAELRTLVAAWTPAPVARSGDGIATGVASIDEALGGGLPRGRVTELVSALPSSGGELVFASILKATRASRLRVALIDAADGFAPRTFAPDLLRHLVWVRAKSVTEAVACFDVLVRDGNYAVIVFDVRNVAPRALKQQPASAWHRLRLASEQNAGAVLIQTRVGFFPAVPWRLILSQPVKLAELRTARVRRMAHLDVQIARGHGALEEEKTG
ncbi:MAG: hypothetical protein JWM32_3124 [Verrucomicrobia bacterium]|nr:hypothetical protein [Verrucomicrobiota bacterium]